MAGLFLILLLYESCTAAALHMTGPSTYTARVGSIAHIPCTFTADTLPADPRFFAIVWNFNGKSIISFDNIIKSTDRRYSLDKKRALNGTADLTISNVSVSDDGDYKCSVIYSPLSLEKDIRVTIIATPSITILNKIVTKNTKSKLKSTISGFYPENIDIEWLRDGQTLDYVIIEKPQRNPDGTYSVNSSATITPTEEDKERTFSCRVQHKSLSSPLQEDFRLMYSAQPQVTILTKSAQRNTKSTLTCMVAGFFPPDIDVTWYKDGEILNNQLMGEPHKINNRTYQVISTVTITPSDDYQNRTFSCRVQHISLQEPLQEDFPLILEDSSSYTTVNVIIVVIVVILGILGAIVVFLWKKKPRRKDDDIKRSTNKELSTLETGSQNSAMDPLLTQRGTQHVRETPEKREKAKRVPLTTTIIPQKDETPHTRHNRDEDNNPSTNTEHPVDKQTLPKPETGNLNSKSINELLSPKQSNLQLPEKSSHIRELEKKEERGKKIPLSPTIIPQKAGTPHTPDNGDEDNNPSTNTEHPVDKQTLPKPETGNLHSKSINELLSPKQRNVQLPEKSSHVRKMVKKIEEKEKNLLLSPTIIPQKAGTPHTPDNRQLPDLEVGQITVPELIAWRQAELSCKLYHYIPGEHKCSWFVKLKSGVVVHAGYDNRKHQSTEKNETSDDQNNYTAYLAFFPTEESDDGSEFILRVNLPDRVIERSTGAVHVRENLPCSSNPHKKKKDLDVSTEEAKDRCGESSFPENSNPQSSDRKETREPHHENQPERPAEEEVASDTLPAMDRPSSEMEPSDEEEFSNLNDTEAEDPKKPSPHSSYTEEAAEDSSSQTDENIKENQNPESENLENEMSDPPPPIDTTSSKLQEGDEEEVDNS